VAATPAGAGAAASWATTPGVRKSMQGNRRSNTKPELRIRSALHRMGFRFRKDKLLTEGSIKVHADVVFTRSRVAVFIDGCFWHRCPQHGSDPKSNRDYWLPKLAANVERDRRVDAALTDAGWRVVRIWEHEDPVEVAESIATIVRRSPG
jgi:DNA mismatch endonuclease, patch repair protein